MQKESAKDFDTYREIMDELLQPISGEDLDADTLKRLYESKLVYLENLRIKCFEQLNDSKSDSHFTTDDYSVILDARNKTQGHIRTLIFNAMTENLQKIA